MRGISKPVVATILVVVALAAGGTFVFLAGNAVDDADRRGLIAWQSEALPFVRSAQDNHAAVGRAAGGARADLVRLRDVLEDEREAIFAIHRPDIVQDTAAAYLNGIYETLRALTILQAAHGARLTAAARATFDARWTAARDWFAEGDSRLVRLRCRARLERCDTLPEI